MADRDENGRFVKGNGCGQGRPKRQVEEKYLELLRKAVTPDDWNKIVLTAIARAKAGDNVARQWLSDWMLGKPVERHEVSGESGGPLVIRWLGEDEDITNPI